MKTTKWVLLVLAVILLGINMLGEFKSLRNPDIYKEQSRMFISGADIEYDNLMQQIARKDDESDKEFALRINKVIYKGMLYYWYQEGAKKYHLTVPIWENYILYIRNTLKSVDRYEFANWRRNLKRGAGLCSAYSIIVKGILEENEIEARMWDLTRHVVVEAKLSENEWYILDPNYGLYVPHSMEEIQQNPELVRATYMDIADLYLDTYNGPYTTDFLVEIFGYDNIRIWSPNPRFENFSYIAKWVLPLLFLLGSGLLVIYGPILNQRVT